MGIFSRFPNFGPLLGCSGRAQGVLRACSGRAQGSSASAQGSYPRLRLSGGCSGLRGVFVEDYRGCLGNCPKDQHSLKFLSSPFLPMLTPTLWTYNSCQNANIALKFSFTVRVETSRYLIKDDDSVERERLRVQAWAFTMQLGELKCVAK